MKFTKTEKIWLAVVALFFVLYNLPFVPKYNHAAAAILHGAVTLIPLWISVYVGLVKVCRLYPLREASGGHENHENTGEQPDSDIAPVDTSNAGKGDPVC